MSDNWRTHAKFWSTQYEVHAIDQRNHGKSFHSQEFNYDLMAADIIAYMDERNIPQAIVLGHSMGGKTAMNLALQYPTRVSKLIVADIAPKKI
jgi:pimeloyl-ACP methyl ester carboxylesterase